MASWLCLLTTILSSLLSMLADNYVAKLKVEGAAQHMQDKASKTRTRVRLTLLVSFALGLAFLTTFAMRNLSATPHAAKPTTSEHQPGETQGPLGQ